MSGLIDRHATDVEQSCRRHGVRRLEVFGSVTGDGFDPLTSDLDFLVDFLPFEPGPHSRAYFGLLHDLEDVFGRPVDLVETAAVKNPFFLKAIGPSRRVVYAA